MKYLIYTILLILMTSCASDIAETASVTSSVTETTTVSSESVTEIMTETTTAKTTTTAPIISTYETTTTVYKPLRNAVELNEVFYIDRDKSNLYLVIDDEITDQTEVADEGYKDSIYFRSAESYSTAIGVFLPNNRVYFNIPTAIVVGNKFYIADETKIKELKFLIDGMELELKYGKGTDYEEVLKLSDTSFIQYIRPDYVLNAEELGFEGKVTFAFNPETLTFDGEIWHNDKIAENIAEELNDKARNLTHIRMIPTEYSFTVSPETRVGDKSKLVKFDGYNGYYSKSMVEGYRTADEYMNLLKSVYTDETAEMIFDTMCSPPEEGPFIIENNGEFYFKTNEVFQKSLYKEPGEPKTYYYDVFSVSENRIEARYVSFHGHEHYYHYNIYPHNLILENTENGWRISQEEYDWWNGIA